MLNNGFKDFFFIYIRAFVAIVGALVKYILKMNFPKKYYFVEFDSTVCKCRLSSNSL